MYLAPLNYDRFFRKVFSDLSISKKFLEDFLDITIEEIEFLEKKHRVTDDATVVEFDFRCRIDGQYTVVDMQQWYKLDVVKRFYLYQSLGCSLQLEDLPKRELFDFDGKRVDSKNYSALMPTVTIVWMAHDSLGFDEDIVAFSPFPEQAIELIKNEALWASNNEITLAQERQKVLTLLNNSTKDVDFLPKNRLIFAFQQNIVKNKKLKKYFDWFELAEKTRNRNNTEVDFQKYKINPTLMAVIERIESNKLSQDERTAWEDFERYMAYIPVWKLGIRDEMRKEVIAEVKKEVRSEVKEEVRSEVKEEVRSEVKEEVRSEVKKELIEEKNTETVVAAFKQGLTSDLIVKITFLPLEKVESIIENYKKVNLI